MQNINTTEAFKILCQDKNTFLIDVRTPEEFHWVGTVSDSLFCNQQILLTWQGIANLNTASNFSTALQNIIENNIPNSQTTAKLYFLCRSGGRSALAATHMHNLGWQHCFNIIYGFEGDLNQEQQRGKKNGWKADNLPWRQS